MSEIESPLNRLRRLGLRTLAPHDLLALAASRDEGEVEALWGRAADLVRKRGINGLGSLGPADLAEFADLDEFDAIRLLAALELGRRAGLSNKGERRAISRADDVVQIFRHLRDETKEHFCAAYMDTKGGVLAVRTIHIGTVNMSVVGAREVFREAVREGATSVIVVHNHPSGDPAPSPEDDEVTSSLKAAGTLLDIPVLDHVILGHHRHFSYLENRRL